MWSPEQYERFKTERRQPFDDLLALVEKRPRMRIVDLGCGTGELTRELHETLGAEETLGIDDSESMLLKAGHFGDEMLRFEKGNIEALVTDKPYDLVFSNAALHWVPDHEQLFVRLTNFLSTRGQIAIQMPANNDHPSHAIAAEVAETLGIARRPDYVLPAERYAELLHRLGYERQHVRLQVYGHVLPSTADALRITARRSFRRVPHRVPRASRRQARQRASVLLHLQESVAVGNVLTSWRLAVGGWR
jgi:trans-aconitate 2-methyltransferase